MRVVRVRNVSEAWARLSETLQGALPEHTRAGAALVVPEPVTTIYERPRERVLFCPRRNANPFFHLVEALWMLAGRCDTRTLDRYVSDFGARYAEDNGQIHGAYGYRWRHALGFDQLEVVVRKLRENPQDRQAVIQMWNGASERRSYERDEVGMGTRFLNAGSNDLRGEWRDRPCLAGDTLVWSPEGDKPMVELAGMFRRGLQRWPVYAVDPVSKKLELQWMTACWRSGRKKTLRLVFDDGSSLRMTKDHVVYRYHKHKGAQTAVGCQAGELQVGDRVLATHRVTLKKGHEGIKKCLGRNTAFNNLQSTHRAYYALVHGPIPAEHDIHHKDELKRNNTIDNLEALSVGEHSRLHRLGNKNPMRRMTAEQHRARAEKHSEALKKNWAALTPEQRSARSKGLELPDNHKIVAIEEHEAENVYDFTVPGFHTAIVGTGVVTHNCNTHVYLRVRKDPPVEYAVDDPGPVDPQPVSQHVLDMTVLCRSNDAVWGAYGANAVHFSVLQEYLAARIGVEVGLLYQVSNNFHVYQDVWGRVRPSDVEMHEAENVTLGCVPMFSDPQWIDHDLRIFMSWHDSLWNGGAEERPIYMNAWFSHTARHVVQSWFSYRARRSLDAALAGARAIDCSAWRLACVEWLERRGTT